jgi:hypothetical protein
MTIKPQLLTRERIFLVNFVYLFVNIGDISTFIHRRSARAGRWNVSHPSLLFLTVAYFVTSITYGNREGEICMSELVPGSAAIVNTIVENAANAVRQAFVLGAQHGGSAVQLNGGVSTLEEWRDEMLSRYGTPSWKRSIVRLVPGCRFRPTDIYITKRAELEALQPANKTLSVGTHNVLGALIRDGAIAKLGDFYAPAVGGVPLSAGAEDPTQTYRPRNSYSEHFARLLGFTVVSWSMLEWEIVDLADAVAPGIAAAFLDKPYAAQALTFSDTVTRFAPRFGPYVAGGLKALAAELHDLAARRADLASARPCTIDGKNVLRSNGVWNCQTLMETCNTFELACSKAHEIADRLRFGQLPATVAATKTVIAESLMPLIALSRIVAADGARPYARALEQSGILDGTEAGVIRRLAREFDRPRNPGEAEPLRAAIEELWSGSRSPGMVRRAIAHRARDAGKVPTELPALLSGENGHRVPILAIDGTTISIAMTTLHAWDESEVIVDLENRNTIAAKGAHVMTVGTRVLGNERAMQLVPWLVDGPA